MIGSGIFTPQRLSKSWAKDGVDAADSGSRESLVRQLEQLTP